MTPAKKTKSESEGPKRRSLFDHVRHIRQVQDPTYYNRLSDDDRKSFNHFMIIRTLSMDEDLVEDMAFLYQIFDKIPSAQFYTLLISLIPRNNKFCPWIKSKKIRHGKELLDLVARRFQVPRWQANEYVNILNLTEEGQGELVRVCRAFGLDDEEIADLFEEKKE